jgi:hypothetical protein
MHGRDKGAGLLSDSDLERLVADLRAIDHESSWHRFIEVGQMVLERIAFGDEAEWRSRRGRKNASLRRLAQHRDCPFRKTVLAAAVNVHLFVKHHAGVQGLPALTPTHVMQVTGLSDSRALELLHRTSERGWSVRELKAHVQAARREAGDRRGRPVSPAGFKATTMARRAVAALRDMRGLISPGAVDPTAARALRVSLDEIADLLTEVRDLHWLRRTSTIVPIGEAVANLPERSALRS